MKVRILKKTSSTKKSLLVKKHVFEIISEDQEKIFYFACPSKEDAKNWVKTLNKFIKSNSKSQGKETIISKNFNFNFK